MHEYRFQIIIFRLYSDSSVKPLEFSGTVQADRVSTATLQTRALIHFRLDQIKAEEQCRVAIGGFTIKRVTTSNTESEIPTNGN